MEKVCLFLYAALLSCVIASSYAAGCSADAIPSTTEGLQTVGQDPVAVIYAKSSRFYNCSTGTPVVVKGAHGPITFTGNPIPANSVSWSGVGVVPNSDDNGDWVVESVNAADGSTSNFNLTLDFTTSVSVPSPDPDKDLPWERWANSFATPSSLGEELGISWAARVDTAGGGNEQKCPPAKNLTDDQFEVPFTATYHFYPCPSTTSGGAVERYAAWWAMMAAAMAMALVI